MRNLLEYPITQREVIDYCKTNIEIEKFTAAAMGSVGDLDPLYAKTALAVVAMASIIIKNDPGSTAAQSLESAFNSQNVPVRPLLEEEMA